MDCRNYLRQIMRLMRPEHWIKNMLIFVPAVFNGTLFEPQVFIKTCAGLAAFSMLASTIYIINDISDIEKDRLNPVKCTRPVASGAVHINTAVYLAIGLLVLCFLLITLNKADALSYLWCLVYLALNLYYSLGHGKDVPLVDIMILAAGFLLRVVFGASISRINISGWLYLVTMTGALYLGLGKRRNELNSDWGKRGKTRRVLKYYTTSFLDKNMYMCMSLVIVFYSLWCMDVSKTKSDLNLLIWTIPLVIWIAMRYSFDIETSENGDPIDVITSDKLLCFSALAYVIAILSILYLI